MRHILNRSKMHTVPSSFDLDGISVGIVRLHDFYSFNLSSSATEVSVQKNEFQSRLHENLTTWDLFRIGLKGYNKMLMRSGIEFMSHALQESMSGNSTVPPFVDPIDQNTLKRLLRTGIKYYYAENDRDNIIKRDLHNAISS